MQTLHDTKFSQAEGWILDLTFEKQIWCKIKGFTLEDKEDLRYNDSVCYQRFCCKIEFAVIKKLDMDPSKAWITDIF